MADHNKKQAKSFGEGVRGYMKGLEVVDYRLIISIVFLVMFGLIMVYSASNAQYGASLLKRQFEIGGLGFIMMLVISYIDYHIYAKFAGALYVLSVLSLFLVKVPGIGVTKNGASRWIEIGPISFQLRASETGNGDSDGLSVDSTAMKKWYADVLLIFPGLIAVGLILFVTKNLSTALIVFGIVAFMFFIAYPDKEIWRWIGVVLVAVVVVLLVYYNLVIVREHSLLLSEGTSATSNADFRSNRILAWLYPDDYPQASMQSRYSMYAIGFGGLLGRGLGNGTMKYYLPYAMNDFIFGVIGEELGLVGCGLVIFLFIYQVWRVFTVSQHAKDRLGSYMAFGIGIHVALQVLLNIGVSTGVLPNTGISLPYISYGGTALLLQLCEMGIVLNISRQIPGRRIRVGDSSQKQDRTESKQVHAA
ncbi:MAG: FtsW/RodA/SpoVE family cell cycle protein [Coprococcus sp.]